MPSTDFRHPEASNSSELNNFDHARLPDEVQSGMEPMLGIWTGDHLENDIDNNNPSNSVNLDGGARLRRDLKAETGYASYFDYLEAYEKIRSLPGVLRLALNDIVRYTARFEKYECAVVDVQDKDNTSHELSLRCRSTSATEILSALRQPATSTKFRIVLWDSTSLTEEMLSALGLGLKIQPHFFNAFLTRHPKTPEWADFNTGWKFSDDVIVVGQYIMTLVYDYPPLNADATPIIVIAGVDQNHVRIDSDFLGTLPFQRPATQATNETPNSLDQLPEWMKIVLRGLDSDLKKGKGRVRNDMDLTFGPPTILLQFSIPLVRLECRVSRACYLQATNPRCAETVDKVLKTVFTARYQLRRMIEDSEDNFLRIRDNQKSVKRHGRPQSQSFMTLQLDFQQTRLEATRLEAEIRDYLQLQTGQLALEESKKSIELSNSQIEEAKRC